MKKSDRKIMVLWLLLLLPLAMRNARAVTLLAHCRTTLQQNPYMSAALVAMTITTGVALSYAQQQEKRAVALSHMSSDLAILLHLPLIAKDTSPGKEEWRRLHWQLLQHLFAVEQEKAVKWARKTLVISKIPLAETQRDFLFRSPEVDRHFVNKDRNGLTTFSLVNENTLEITTSPS